MLRSLHSFDTHPPFTPPPPLSPPTTQNENAGRERQSVAGTVGGEIRREQMAEATGGDASKAYAEMGSKGGGARGGSGEEETGGTQ